MLLCIDDDEKAEEERGGPEMDGLGEGGNWYGREVLRWIPIEPDDEPESPDADRIGISGEGGARPVRPEPPIVVWRVEGTLR